MVNVVMLIVSLFLVNKEILQTPININVEISGVKKIKGDIRIAIYSAENKFPSGEDILDYRIIPVSGESVTCTFQVEKKGQYALALVQDLNKNGTMDFNLVGWPKEPYAFSKNPGIWYRAPKFEECAINVQEDISIEIKMD